MRPELATIDGTPPPADLPRGECIISEIRDPAEGPRFRIDHADPRILISARLLDGVVLSPAPGVALDMTDAQVGYIGALLKISAINRQVIYCITEYVASVHGYIGERQD